MSLDLPGIGRLPVDDLRDHAAGSGPIVNILYAEAQHQKLLWSEIIGKALIDVLVAVKIIIKGKSNLFARAESLATPSNTSSP